MSLLDMTGPRQVRAMHPRCVLGGKGPEKGVRHTGQVTVIGELGLDEFELRLFELRCLVTVFFASCRLRLRILSFHNACPLSLREF